MTKYISGRKDYIELFKNAAKKNENDWQSDALKYALEIRKFEIDLYWKRAAYFWAFIALSFTGYFSLQKGGEQNHFILKFLLSCIGLIISVAWWLVNRGSKYWQENWERHVDLLEDEVIGPLYKTIPAKEEYKFWNFFKAYPYSVSKINHILSFFAVVIWGGLWLYMLYRNFWPMPFQNNVIFSLLTIVTVVFLGFLLFRAKTEFRENHIKFKCVQRIYEND